MGLGRSILVTDGLGQFGVMRLNLKICGELASCNGLSFLFFSEFVSQFNSVFEGSVTFSVVLVW